MLFNNRTPINGCFFESFVTYCCIGFFLLYLSILQFFLQKLDILQHLIKKPNWGKHKQSTDIDSCQNNARISSGIIHKMRYSLRQAELYFDGINTGKKHFFFFQKKGLKKMKGTEIKRVPKHMSVSNTQIKSDE